MPLNSCANPFLYAIFTKQFKKDCALLCRRIEDSALSRTLSQLSGGQWRSARHGSPARAFYKRPDSPGRRAAAAAAGAGESRDDAPPSPPPSPPPPPPPPSSALIDTIVLTHSNAAESRALVRRRMETVPRDESDGGAIAVTVGDSRSLLRHLLQRAKHRSPGRAGAHCREKDPQFPLLLYDESPRSRRGSRRQSPSLHSPGDVCPGGTTRTQLDHTTELATAAVVTDSGSISQPDSRMNNAPSSDQQVTATNSLTAYRQSASRPTFVASDGDSAAVEHELLTDAKRLSTSGAHIPEGSSALSAARAPVAAPPQTAAYKCLPSPPYGAGSLPPLDRNSTAICNGTAHAHECDIADEHNSLFTRPA